MIKPLTRLERRLMEANALVMTEAVSDQDKAFLARQLVQTTLPHSDPGNTPVWSRTNGDLTLTIQQGYNGDGSPVGHPFGTIPRLLMYWMTTEALRTKSNRLELGDSLAGFMEELGLDSSRGGKRSDAYRLREQMRRLFDARVSFTQIIEQDGRTGEARDRMQIAEKTMLWWDNIEPRQRALWDSYVVLDPRFCEAITANPVPVDLRALRAIKRSPLALDLYSLLTYNAFRAAKRGKAYFIPWRLLQTALGTGYANHADLRTAVKAALRSILAVYPDLAIGDRQGGIEVLPSSLPAVERR